MYFVLSICTKFLMFILLHFSCLFFAPFIGLMVISHSSFPSIGFEVIYSIVSLVDVNLEYFKWIYSRTYCYFHHICKKEGH